MPANAQSQPKLALKSHSSCARLRKGLETEVCRRLDQRSDVLRLAQEVRGLMPSEMKAAEAAREENQPAEANVCELSLEQGDAAGRHPPKNMNRQIGPDPPHVQ